MSKQWSIIFTQKKNFENFNNYKSLVSNLNLAITPVKKGINKGCYGIRLYNMSQNPSKYIVELMLDYIFTNAI